MSGAPRRLVRQRGILLELVAPFGPYPGAYLDRARADMPAPGHPGTAGHGGAEATPSRYFLISVVLLAFVMNTLARGVTETFAVFLLPVEKGLGISRSEITAAYSVYMLALGCSAPFAGQLIDRVGVRFTYGVGLAILGSGYWLAGTSQSLWEYYLYVGLLGGLGGAAIGMVVASSLISRWFMSRLGTMMSLPYAAVGVGMLTLPLLTQVLLETYDWRQVYKILGLIVLSMLPFVLFLPLGRMSEGSPEWRERRRIVAQTSGPWNVSNAAKTGAFWGLFTAYYFTSVAAYSVLPQSVAYLVELGFDPLVAAGAFGFTGMLSAIGILLIGWLSDRFGRKPAVTFSYFCSITGTILLILVAGWPSLILVYGFVLFFGLMQGARGPVILSYVASLYPGGAVGSIFGTLSLAMGLGAATGSWGSGLLHELTGNYNASFILGALASLTGLMAFWLVPSLRKERLLGRHASDP
ncbi:MAG: MFS transporter [Hyphomicrobiaceae bacterium]